MSERKHINYSAADIERYHKGLMTATEMNALEKAALDDPFLADAMEGYAAVPVNTASDIAVLNKKIDARVKNDNKVIALRKLNFTWLRIAALFIIIAGAGALAYTYVLQDNKQEVAAVQKTDTTSHTAPAATDTIKEPIQTTATVTADTNEAVKAGNETVKGEVDSRTARNKPAEQEHTEPVKGPATRITAAPEKLNDIVIKKEEDSPAGDSIRSFAATANAAKARSATQNEAGLPDEKKEQAQFKTKTSDRAPAPGNNSMQHKINYFRGQVTDSNSLPLPFANVTIIPDNIGTYTDAKGNFTLISPDSVLNVRVHSVGFENSMESLSDNTAGNSIVLKQDTKKVPATVVNAKKLNTVKRQQGNITVEEPEPADGWYNYDTYIANNINISDEIKTKTSPGSEVELSFDVNKYGEPVNIKIEKSVCRECDEEAIRLLKEGPKWKKKKNKRAKVSVGFSRE